MSPSSPPKGAPPVASAAPVPSASAVASASDDDAAPRQFAAWLAAFNSGDRAVLVAYHQASFPYAAASRDVGDVDRELVLSRVTGGFDLKRAEEATSTRFIAILAERNADQFARASMDVEAAAPHRVVRFEIGPIPTPDAFRVQRMTEADAIAALRDQIAKSVAGDRFSGVVLVAKNGAPIFSEAYGLADRDKKLPNELGTRFRIGSMNKMFTAVAILQLVQAKKLALTDTLAKLLPDYPNKEVASKVTLHHLLTHTGGTGDIFGPDFDAHRLGLRTLQDYVKLYAARPLRFEPGAKWEYSNYGFILLGVVIERVTRKTYYEWIDAHVFKPAGMISSASPVEEQGGQDRSVGYTKADPAAPWTSAANTLPYRGTSAGGGDSTVGDLLRFANALTRHELLDAEHTALLTTGKVETPDGGKYSYGFGETTLDGVRCLGHGGGAPGMNGALDICESGYTVAVLANLDPPAANRLSGFIRRRLPAK